MIFETLLILCILSKPKILRMDIICAEALKPLAILSSGKVETISSKNVSLKM